MKYDLTQNILDWGGEVIPRPVPVKDKNGMPMKDDKGNLMSEYTPLTYIVAITEVLNMSKQDDTAEVRNKMQETLHRIYGCKKSEVSLTASQISFILERAKGNSGVPIVWIERFKELLDPESIKQKEEL